MASKFPSPSLDYLLCLDLYTASRAVTKAYGPLLQELGLTYPQYLVMVALWEKGDLKVKELSARLHLDSGTVSPLLKRLEGAGCLTRQRGKEDEREVTVTLTDRGRAMQKKNGSVQEGIIRLFGLTLPQAQELQRTLRGVINRLDPGPAYAGSL